MRLKKFQSKLKILQLIQHKVNIEMLSFKFFVLKKNSYFNELKVKQQI